MKDQSKKSKISMWVLVLFCVAAVPPFIYILQKYAWQHETVLNTSTEVVMDFGFLNLASDGCYLTGPDGQSVKEKLLASSADKTVIIPEGTVITGDCFIRKNNVGNKDQ